MNAVVNLDKNKYGPARGRSALGRHYYEFSFLSTRYYININVKCIRSNTKIAVDDLLMNLFCKISNIFLFR